MADTSGYCGELASYFNSKSDFIFKSILFDSADELAGFISSTPVDMLLCDEDMTSDIPPGVENVCLLCDESYVSDEAGYGVSGIYHRIFKYQSSEAIMEELVSYYKSRQMKIREDREVFEADKRIICVHSPMGGCYSSTFALALSQYLSKGGKTLFISFDPFFMYPGEDKNRADKNLTDLIYYMEVSGKGVASFVEKLTYRRDDLDYISGVSHWFDIADMSREKMRKLIEELNASGLYDNIVFDLRIMGEASMELLTGCKEIYMPLKKGSGSAGTVNEWKRQMLYANKPAIIEKTKEITVPYDELLDGEYSFDVLLKGRLGRFIEELEGLRYSR